MSVDPAPSLSSMGDTASDLELLEDQVSLHQEYALRSPGRSTSLPSALQSRTLLQAANLELQTVSSSSLDVAEKSEHDASDSGLDFEIDLPDATDILAEIGSHFVPIALNTTIPMTIAS